MSAVWGRMVQGESENWVLRIRLLEPGLGETAFRSSNITDEKTKQNKAKERMKWCAQGTNSSAVPADKDTHTQ